MFVCSVCLLRFANQPDGTQFVIIGVAKDYQLNPKQVGGGFLYTYRLNPECTELALIHKTVVEDIPYAICPFQGRVLIGVGRMLRLYDLGKKKLLRKCENKV